ncbi:MAG: sugar phosphate isomerase/epimerase family protein, partial [Bacteroidales bacterium]
WKEVLRKTTEMGYTEIETGSYLGESAESYLSFLKEIGLKAIAGGTRLFEDKDELNRSLDKLNALELKYVVIYWPWLVGAPFSLEDCKRSSELLNSIGEVCNSRGLQLCWHNHDNEFKEMEEGMPFDYLMENTDKELVKCELDVYWVKKGGADPVEVLKEYSGRYPILHIKDMAPGSEQDFACVGDGIVNFPDIFAEAFDQGIEHFFVERDKVVDGMACLSSAAEYLKSLRF